MANRTFVHSYLAIVALTGGLSLGCDDGRPPVAPSPPPTPAGLMVQALSPTSGSIYGPTTITILGSGFDSHVIVILDGRPVTEISGDSTRITFVAPAHAAGQVPVVVANGNGQTVSAPAFTYRAAPPHVFTEAATGFSTSDLRDAQDDIVRVDRDGYLIWAEGGTALKGFSVVDGIRINMAGHCVCVLEVRFGTEDGERRAYMTADWGHDNPGTVVDLALNGDALVVRRSARYPPGSYTLSVFVTEATPAGAVPLEGVTVHFFVSGQGGLTDRNGLHQLRGLYDSDGLLEVRSPGYHAVQTRVSIRGDTRLDVQLVRR